MYPRSEILFPHKSILTLKNLRGEGWRELVERIAVLPETHEDNLAFCLMMIKLCDCLNCDLGSYKASLGCSTCARRAVLSAKGSDAVLFKRFEKAKEEVLDYLERAGLKKSKVA